MALSKSLLLLTLLQSARALPSLKSHVAPIKPQFNVTATTAIYARGGETSGIVRRLEVGGLFAFWYALNVYYNILNKKVLKTLPLPWLVGGAQLGVGALYSLLAWGSGLRRGPADLVKAVKAAAPVAAAHGAGQAATVVSLGAGAVSATHVVKALEPLFSAAVNAFVRGEVLPLPVYASLLPVVGGVAVAVASDLSTFNALSVCAAMSSNLCFAFRAVLSKAALAAPGPLRELSAPSLFGVVTIGATLLVLPVALLLEGGGAAAAIEAAGPAPQLLVAVALSGLFHYLNNEAMYLVLARVHPVTLAVGNTLKRTVIILAAMVVFREAMKPVAAAGTSVAIAGVLLYSILKQKLVG